MFQIKVVQNVKTHFLFDKHIFEKRAVCAFMTEKQQSQRRHRWHNMAHAHFTLRASGYKHTLTICYLMRIGPCIILIFE